MVFSRDQLDRLGRTRTIDLTTYGRKSGLPRRIEIWWFRVEGRFIITGTPGRRDWLANVLAHPGVIVHANGHDIEATAVPIDDAVFRRTVFTQSETSWYVTQEQLEELIETAPMIEMRLPAKTTPAPGSP